MRCSFISPFTSKFIFSFSIRIAALSVAAGCVDAFKDGDIDTSAGVDSADSGDSADSDDTVDSGPTGLHGTVTGNVYLQLYTTDADGDLVLLDWDESYGYYPFGSVFVGAYHLNDTGYQVYYGQDAIAVPTVSPAPGGDPYQIALDADDVDSVYVYASVDQYADGIIGTGEPTTAYASEVYAADGETVTGIDITVMVPYWDLSGGGGCSDTVQVTGSASVGTSYLEGAVALMLYDTSNNGPYYSSWVTPMATSTGAEADYTVVSCAQQGEMKMLGAWDSNVNGLIDPADQWGAYVNADDEDANPITIASGPIANVDVLIPFGENHPTVIPFISLSGTLTSSTDWSTWGGVHIAALKYRPDGDITVDELSAGYDVMSWTNADLIASSSLDYHLEVPANTITYLWAYGDPNGDGVLNGPDEAVAGLAPNGRVVTGTSNQDGIDLRLVVVPAP